MTSRKSLHFNNARGGIRTHTGLPPRDFKELSPSVRDYTKHHNSALYKRISALPFPCGMLTCAELWSLIGRTLGATVRRERPPGERLNRQPEPSMAITRIRTW